MTAECNNIELDSVTIKYIIAQLVKFSVRYIYENSLYYFLYLTYQFENISKMINK